MEIYGWAIGNTNGREKEMAKAAVNRTVGRTCSALTFQIIQFGGFCVCVCVEIRFSFCIGISFSPQLQFSWEKKTTTHRNSLMTFVSNFYPLDKFLLHRCRRRRRHLPELNDSSMNCFVRWLTKYSALVYTHSKRITQFPLCSLFFDEDPKKNIPIYFGCQTFSGWNIPSTKSEYCIGFYDPPKLSCWQLNRHQILQFTDSIAKKFGKSTVEIQQLYRAPEKSVPCRELERERQNV